MSNYEAIKLDIANGVATLTLHRPDRMNAFNELMMHEMIAAFDVTDADDSVRAVIVTGEGRAFCAGADLASAGDTFNYEKRLAGRGVEFEEDRVRDGGGRVGLRIYESKKPVIAAINGPAVGVGATMTLPMDVRLAVEGAKMGFVFAKRGIVPETLSSYFLPRLVGVSTALEWVMTGRVFSSEEAKERGLVRSLYKPDDLLPAAHALAREIADNTSPVSVALSRRMLLDMLDASHPMEAHRLESRLMVARGRAGDAKEGVTSFLEKRVPAYPDKVSTDMPQPYPWRPTPAFKE
ncbi:crotonase/enoyl-CoA hydratase family protein [Candidatus Viadribacter manganicus]|uniref:Enoyl-CoA hydratase n=1 Tax=Candidatus Viadribacter manganicus TaxID=1759059 RepID=A0A1B1AEG3_9PROT|nr:crotonase/enoyl-CoA hydratase family protein [Candidatus Viadribacter manganicus]ANP44948.1 enoyl-CoA hydratase [Candidatus Viadribacter manganicus]